jgi:DNA-binding Lrp family transcriptional regulator
VLLLAAFNAAEIIYLFIHKANVEKDEKRKEELKHRAATAIITVTDPTAVLKRPAEELEYSAYSEAVASVIESFEGEVAGRAAGIITAFGIDSYYRNLARGPVWYKRASAIDILSSFKLKENREFFLGVFRSETSNTVKYRVLYGLSLLVRDLNDIDQVAKMLSSLPYLTAKYTEDIFFNIITAVKLAGKEDEFGLFMTRSMKDPGVRLLLKRDALSACYYASCERAMPIVKAYYDFFPDEPEILVACIKSLVRMGDFSITRGALKHKDWRVRLTAVKYAQLGGTEILPDLEAMLRDRNYHLRVNAAIALTKMNAQGMKILRAEAASKDKYAADAASYALTLAKAGS